MTSEHMGAIRGAAASEAPGNIVVTLGEGAEVLPNDTNPDSPPPLVIVDGEGPAGATHGFIVQLEQPENNFHHVRAGQPAGVKRLRPCLPGPGIGRISRP